MNLFKIADTYAIVQGQAHRPSFWLIAGVHGEEPAPVVAVSKSMTEVFNLCPIPVVVIPLANPSGLAMHQRFGDRGVRDGYDFVVDADTLAGLMPPKFVLDLHEDDELEGGVYVYHHGVDDGLPGLFLEAFKEAHVELLTLGYPRFSDQEVVDGLVIQQGEDNSIDEYLNLYGAEVIVVETPSKWLLEKRVGVHRLAIQTALSILARDNEYVQLSLDLKP